MTNMKSIDDFLNHFKSEKICLDYIKNIRFKNGVYCPYCKSRRIYTFSNGTTYKCSACLKKFNVKTLTIFEKSKISLQKWLLAIFIMTSNKDTIKPIELAKLLNVTQRTLWYLDERIRKAYSIKSDIKLNN